MKNGRPPKFKNPKDLEKKINKYIEVAPDKTIITDKDGKEYRIPHYTISGLAYYLGFTSRQSFYDYEKNEKFSYIIKRARFFIEKEYEKLLQGNNCTGIIFALKNMGWSDKTEQEITQKVINIEVANSDDKDLLEGL